jgi:GlcNAc-PI de-N-acetylase
MVVAHPDDESLFGGAQLLEGGWKVICVTNGYHSVRRLEFEKAMKFTNSDFEIWNYYDQQGLPLDDYCIREDIRRVINSQDWYKVVTHNEYGEYGHKHHIQIHNILKSMMERRLWTFDLNQIIPLPQSVWENKLKLIQIYQSQKQRCDAHIPIIKNEGIHRQITVI